MKKTLVLLSILSASFAQSQQDPHFSMWNASPSLFNPAANATMVQDYSAFTNYRGQWLTALDAPLRTNAVSIEAKLGEESIQNGWFGIGAHYFNDATGDTKIQSNIVSIPLNYVYEGYDNAFFSMGITPGIINRSVKADFQTWDNQWNGIAFDNTINSTESSASKSTRLTVGAGVYYKKLWRNRSKFDIGFAANHLNAPEQGFQTLSFQTFRQFVFHTSGSIRLDKYRFLLSPSLITMFQGPHRNITIGTSMDFLLSEGSQRTTFVQERTFGFGLNYRMNDAIIASFMLKMNGFQVGASYDALLFANRTATNTVGAVELFLKYSFYKDQNRRFLH